jgi:hypothetical protein
LVPLLALGLLYAARVSSQPDAPGAPEAEAELPRLEPDDVQLIETGPKPLDLSVWNAAEAVRGAANRQVR